MKREKPKSQTLKLNLHRESLRRLNDGELRPAIGGYLVSLVVSSCETQC